MSDTLTVPVDSAATVNAYIRSSGQSFALGAPDGTDTTVGAGNALVLLNVAGTGNYYIDIELVGSANCKSYYRSQDPIFPAGFSSTYFEHQHDLTNTQNRVNTTATNAVTFTINP